MNKIILAIICILFSAAVVNAQLPKFIDYQAIVRNSNGEIIRANPVSLKFSIISNSINGQSVYTEMHTVSTNNFGVVSLEIGNGSVLAGTFRNIDWQSGKYFLKTFTDLTGGEHFTEMGTVEILVLGAAVQSENSTAIVDSDAIPNDSYVTDYDGNVYERVEIGNQVWLSSNLKSQHYADGTKITGVYSYEDLNENAEEYGRLYTWNAAMNNEVPTIRVPVFVQGVCPSGYHLPSLEEWEELKNYIKTTYKVGGGLIGLKLKEEGGTHWNNRNGKLGNNETGFSAIGAGSVSIAGSQKLFRDLKDVTTFWSATKYANNADQARIFKLYDSGATATAGGSNKTNGYSVRCVKD